MVGKQSERKAVSQIVRKLVEQSSWKEAEYNGQYQTSMERDQLIKEQYYSFIVVEYNGKKIVETKTVGRYLQVEYQDRSRGEQQNTSRVEQLHSIRVVRQNSRNFFS